jgi:hypothetical protein
MQFSSKHKEENSLSHTVQSEMLIQETNNSTKDHNENAQYKPCPNTINFCSSQRTIKDWVIHPPFIPNVTNAHLTSQNQYSPSHPHQTFSAHLEPFGMPLPVIDHTKILRVCMQNPQHDFKIHGNRLEIYNIISNLKKHWGINVLPDQPKYQLEKQFQLD